jgi:hypothetical protein
MLDVHMSKFIKIRKSRHSWETYREYLDFKVSLVTSNRVPAPEPCQPVISSPKLPVVYEILHPVLQSRCVDSRAVAAYIVTTWHAKRTILHSVALKWILVFVSVIGILTLSR